MYAHAPSRLKPQKRCKNTRIRWISIVLDVLCACMCARYLSITHRHTRIHAKRCVASKKPLRIVLKTIVCSRYAVYRHKRASERTNKNQYLELIANSAQTSNALICTHNHKLVSFIHLLCIRCAMLFFLQIVKKEAHPTLVLSFLLWICVYVGMSSSMCSTDIFYLDLIHMAFYRNGEYERMRTVCLHGIDVAAFTNSLQTEKLARTSWFHLSFS